MAPEACVRAYHTDGTLFLSFQRGEKQRQDGCHPRRDHIALDGSVHG